MGSLDGLRPMENAPLGIVLPYGPQENFPSGEMFMGRSVSSSYSSSFSSYLSPSSFSASCDSYSSSASSSYYDSSIVVVFVFVSYSSHCYY